MRTVIGIDVGGTGLKAGVVYEQGKILATAKCPTGVERGYGPVIADMAKISLEALEKCGVSLDDVKAIGIGIPGVQDPATGLVPLGDMCISLERAKAQAAEFGHSVRREVGYLTIHSMLHLLGYDHLDEGPMKAQMRGREEVIAASIPKMSRD